MRSAPSAPAPRLRLVCFDVDGTLTLGHGWERVAAHRGRLEEFEEAQARFRLGLATEGEHLTRLLNLATGLPWAEMEQVLASIRKLAHLRNTVATLHRQGALVALLTHNPDYVCRWYSDRYGFDLWAGVSQPIRAGRIQRVRRLTVDKREGLRLLLEATNLPAREAAHVGDGRADALVFPHVGTGIALNSLLPEVERAADVVVRTEDARVLLPHLRTASRRRVRPLPLPSPVGNGSFRYAWARTGPHVP